MTLELIKPSIMKTNKAFLAFIDILGYSDFVKTFSSKKYAEIIAKSLSVTDGWETRLFSDLSKYVSVTLLSDSMIIVLDMRSALALKKHCRAKGWPPGRSAESVVGRGFEPR